jgi:hypothetical protein
MQHYQDDRTERDFRETTDTKQAAGDRNTLSRTTGTASVVSSLPDRLFTTAKTLRAEARFAASEHGRKRMLDSANLLDEAAQHIMPRNLRNYG